MPEYDKEAAAERQKARTKELTDKLEAGMKELYNSDKYKDYLKTMSNFHNYSRNNIMLIHQQMPNATKIASFKLWDEKFNRHVRKGESGLYIYAPIKSQEPEKKMFEKLDPETGTPLLDENGKVIMEELTALTNSPRFKLVPVFDVSQTYGDPMPELVENISGDVKQYTAFIDALKDVSPLPIEFEPMRENQDGYCQFGEKIGIRDNMSETQTVCAVIHEMTHAKLHDKQDIAENTESKKKRVKEIEAESIAYVVCQHYGIETSPNSFGYLAEYGSRDMSEIKASLDIIRKEANIFITAIDEKFNAICKERGIDLTAKEPEPTTKPLEQTEPIYSTETHTENIAGMDFEFQEVNPETIEKTTENFVDEYEITYWKMGTGILALHYFNEKSERHGDYEELAKINPDRSVVFRKDDLPDDVKTKINEYALTADIPNMAQNNTANVTLPEQDSSDITMPDPAIGFSEMNLYGYTADGILPLTADKAVDLFNQDITVYLLYPDNTEAMAYKQSEIKDHDGIFGVERDDWLNSKEYKDMGGKADITTEGALESAFIHAKKDSYAIYQIRDGIEKARDYRFEGLDYLKERGWEVNRNNYVLVYTDTLAQSDTLDSIYQKYNIDCPKDFPGHSLSVSDIIVLQQNGEVTSHYVDKIGFAELPAFLGVEKQQAQTAQTTEQPETDYNVIPQPEPPPLETSKKDTPIYKYPVDYALQSGEIKDFHKSREINVECGQAIDKAIIDSNYEQYRYDLKGAAKTVIEEYGVDRAAWVLASNINHYDWDGRLSNTNKAWAKEFDTPKPDIYLKTHLAVLDGFVDRFREVVKEKPSLLDTLNKNEQKSRNQFSQTTGIDKETSKTKKNGEEL